MGTTTDGERNAIPNFIPIMVVNTFVLNGGDFYNTYPLGQGPFEEGDVVTVDWSKPKNVEAWLDSPYQGDILVRNRTRLETSVNSIAEPLTGVKKDYTGDFGIGRWNFSGDNKN